MHDEQAFLQAMQQNPEDAALRLAFADWLEERGDLRSELVRLSHTLTQAVKVRGRRNLEDRLRALWASRVQPVGPFWTNSIGMKFAWIPAGTFLMGSPPDEWGREDKEPPPHKVTLTKGFYLGIHPVTQACWRKIMQHNPSHFLGDDLPVESVSWHDCQEFITKLNAQDKQAYRLPTEAEWEFACRAGTMTPFSFGDTISTNDGNFDGTFPYGGIPPQESCRGSTTPVGSFQPNGWGLYDMHGNVWEWCADLYGKFSLDDAVDPQGPKRGQTRVLRGGSYFAPASHVRSATRGKWEPIHRDDNVGFRVARTFA